MEIEKETLEMIFVAILFSFIGYLFWTSVFWIANHIYIEWI